MYKTVKIGKQIWMAENLKTTRYKDSTPIPNVTNNDEWFYLTTDAYCHYDNDHSNNAIYGKLYNWYAVKTGKLAPKGWHIPTDAEWTILTTYLGGESIAGGKMKFTNYWKSPNKDATNSSGFNGLPAGYRTHFGSFNTIGKYGNFWSSTEGDKGGARNRSLSYDNSTVYRGYNYYQHGYSVRCIKD